MQNQFRHGQLLFYMLPCASLSCHSLWCLFKESMIDDIDQARRNCYEGWRMKAMWCHCGEGIKSASLRDKKYCTVRGLKGSPGDSFLLGVAMRHLVPVAPSAPRLRLNFPRRAGTCMWLATITRAEWPSHPRSGQVEPGGVESEWSDSIDRIASQAGQQQA